MEGIFAIKSHIVKVNSRVLFVVLLAIMFLGCSSSKNKEREVQKPKSQEVKLPDFSSVNTENVFAYNCGDSLQFAAHVTKDSTWLFLADTTVKVLPVKAGSGAKYEGNAFLYWSKGDEAILQRPKGSFVTCRTVPKEKSWQAARIRGVDFRALGQEPGWHLEMKEGQELRYIGNYGKDTLITDMPKPEKTEQRTIYHARGGSRTIVIEILDEPCTDSMSGFQFPSSVTVTVDGKTYRGCGRALD